jgi:hypothetical protein
MPLEEKGRLAGRDLDIDNERRERSIVFKLTIVAVVMKLMKLQSRVMTFETKHDMKS